MNTRPAVGAWFEENNPPMKAAMLRVREVTHEADPRLEECIKRRTPAFTFKGNIASFNPAKKLVSLVFHQGPNLPRRPSPSRRDAKTTRVMRFHSVEDIERWRSDLESAVRARCAWKG